MFRRFWTAAVAVLVIFALTGVGVGSSAETARAGVTETAETIVITGDTYRMTIVKDGFRYGFADASDATTLPPHETSGLRVRADGADDFADAVTTDLVSNSNAATAALDVALENGETVRVHVHPSRSTVRITVDDIANAPATVDLRTAPAAGPAYGLGDYGAHANGQPDEGTPCSGRVEARPTTELTGIVLDNLTNEGSCKRFVSTFMVFPQQGVGQVLFDGGQKRVALTETENRLGVAGVDEVDAVHYFLGADLKQVYADYQDAREDHGYVDVQPRPDMFELGWEAYGALGWDTYQSSVEETVQGFLDHGYPLGWGVVGSGFWPGPRGNRVEGTTNSFGMWDDTHEPGREDARPGLPNPRYPDPDGLKQLFAENDLDLLLGARNNFKAAPEDGGNHNEKYDGPFMPEAAANGYLLQDPDGSPTVVTRAQFPSGSSYVLDGSDPQAVEWYVDKMRLWDVDGWKEDTMLYGPDLHRDGNWNPVQTALADTGDLLMVRNAAYSVPGDIIRINDTIYGTGDVFHEDPDRMPVNLLNMAAAGAGNLYPDYVGGTPGPPMDDPAYMDYFVRNAQFNAMTPVLAFGKGPWELGRADYAEQVKDLALWHDALHPYIYDAVLDGDATGYPSAMTPLPIAYPDDENTYGLVNDETRQYEWMFGESLLATPVFGADFDTAQARDVYLPEGKWIDYETGAVFTGPRTLDDYAMGTDRVPAFVGGKGVLVTRTGDGMRAEVYPVATGSRYEWTDGEAESRIVNANTGWDPESLRITDRTAGTDVDFEVDDVTGAFRFHFEPGHDYVLAGGGQADHSLPIEAAPPETAPSGVTHDLENGQVTLSWEPVDGARSYTVGVTGGGRCEAGVAGSTTGTAIGLGAAEEAGGTYTVTAVNAAGAGPVSEPYTIETPGDDGIVIVTNEGQPTTCDPDTPAYEETGRWGNSSLKGFDGSRTRYASIDGSTAIWSAELEDQEYDVAVWFPAHSNSTSAATYRIRHAGGVTEVVVDQKSLGGQWVPLGTWDFTAAELGQVTLAVGGGGYHRADAVRFRPSGLPEPEEPGGADEHPGTGTWTASSSLLGDAQVADQTVRMIARTSIGGTDMRVRLSNVFGDEPVTFDRVYAGQQEGGANLVDGSNAPVMFDGATAVTVPAGDVALSDPVPGHVEAGTDVVVSAYISGTVDDVTGHLRSSQTTYLAAGDHAASEAGAEFTDSVVHWFFLDRISFDTPDGDGAVVVVGDSITDGGGEVPDRNLRWPDHLGRRIRELPQDEWTGVLNAGMSGNRILFDGYGPSTISRFDRDALSQPGVHTVVLLQGITDVSRSVTTSGPLIDAYTELADRAHAAGVRMVVGTLTPFEGASAYTEAKEAVRQEVNEFLRTSEAFDGVVDFDAALRDPDRPQRLLPAYDGGDHLHPSDAGRERLAEAVDLDVILPPAQDEPALRLTVSEAETFHDSDSAADMCGSTKVHIDSPVRAVADQHGTVHLTVSDPRAQGWQWTGSAAEFAASPADVTLDCTPVMDGENVDADATLDEIDQLIDDFDQKTWIQGLHFDEATSTIHAYGHEDFFGTRLNALDDVCHQAGAADGAPYCWYSAVTAWRAPVSPDPADDHLNFGPADGPAGHVAIYPPMRYPGHADTPTAGWLGFGTPSNIVRGGHDGGAYSYLLAYASATFNPADDQDGQRKGVCLFRSADPADPGSWQAWTGSGYARFTNPYVPGDANTGCQRLAPHMFRSSVRSLQWHEESGRYIAVYRDSDGVRYSTSEDLMTWSPSATLLGATGAEANYPVLIDFAAPAHGDHDFGSIVGDDAYLYYRESVESGHTRIVRRALEVSVRGTE